MNKREINERLKELGHIYDQLNGPDLEIGICGGAALILTDLVSRVTKDV
ncbi:MAG: hypothetical protein HY466_01630, partial [Deltaproteobacteria bacterium]|nr:hypothetical protein [Deltaproteobacteria bacterium]